MRLDKYLKVSRLIKRRSLAKEVCDQGRVLINDRVAKAASMVKEGDVLCINLGQRVLQVRVEALKNTARKEEAAMLFSVLADKRRDLDL